MSELERLHHLAHLFKGFVDTTIEELDTCCPEHITSLLDLYERFMSDTKSSLLGQALSHQQGSKKNRN